MPALTEYTFTLPAAVVDLIGKGLGELPWKDSAQLIQWFQMSCAKQQADAEATQQVPATLEPAVPPPAEEAALTDGIDTSNNTAG